MMWDELESLYESIHFQNLARFGGFVWNMVPSIYPWSSLRVHLAAASAPVSDLGIRRESVQDAIQKFMYHDDVRPKRPVMGWDLWCYVGGADGSCQKKHRFHGILATFNDLIHPESEAIYRFSLENDNHWLVLSMLVEYHPKAFTEEWSILTSCDPVRRFQYDEAFMDLNSWISTSEPRSEPSTVSQRNWSAGLLEILSSPLRLALIKC